MERLIDPAITDLQTEYEDAMRRRQVWRARWVRLCGSVAFMKVLAQCGPFEVRQAMREWSPDDTQGLSRAIGIGVIATVIATVLLEAQQLSHVTDIDGKWMVELAFFLVPSTLALSLPAGFAVGIALSLSTRHISRSLVLAILAISLAASLVQFVNLGWVTPNVNQAFREEWARQAGWPAPIARGLREVSLGELGRTLNTSTLPSRDRVRVFEYHNRIASAAIALTLAGFVLVIVTRRRPARPIATIAASAAPFGYLMLLWFAQALAKEGFLTPAAAAWFPHLALIAVMAAMPRRHPRRLMRRLA
jgi:lipopolysaccharide export LptBFGC system permease protein LptF